MRHSDILRMEIILSIKSHRYILWVWCGRYTYVKWEMSIFGHCLSCPVQFLMLLMKLLDVIHFLMDLVCTTTCAQ